MHVLMDRNLEMLTKEHHETSFCPTLLQSSHLAKSLIRNRKIHHMHIGVLENRAAQNSTVSRVMTPSTCHSKTLGFSSLRGCCDLICPNLQFSATCMLSYFI